MAAITRTPEDLEFEKLPMLDVDGDGEQQGFSNMMGRSADSYRNFGKYNCRTWWVNRGRK